MAKTYSAETVILAKSLRKRGFTYREIGEKLGLTMIEANTICRRSDNPVERTDASRPWTSAEDDRLVKLVGEGREASVVARSLRRSVAGIRDRASRLGHPFCAVEAAPVPDHLPPAVAARNYAAIADKLDAGLRDPRNNVAENKRGAGAEAPALSRLSLAVPPRGRELNVWME